MATQFILKIRVLVPDGVSEYDVENVINKMITSGMRRNIGVNDWIIGTAIATETNGGFPDILLPDLDQ